MPPAIPAPSSPATTSELMRPPWRLIRRNMGYFGGGGGPGGWYGLQPVNGYFRHPRGSVARDKRDARKARNRSRNKR